ncbi:MAG TPA: hypothetical protein VJ831_03470 [Jatrophihabitantaceae bacterium]|nr:hypothetical protein [Jatrophihabitantaceae bacterium]
MELIDDGAGGVISVRPRLRDHLSARVHAQRIDRRLAAGASPDESVTVALRGRLLTGPRSRRTLACGIEHAIAAVTDDAAFAFVDRASVRRSLSELYELRDRLDSDPLPSPTGMARTRLLLTDGASPLFNRDTSVGLQDTLRAVLAGFDPR